MERPRLYKVDRNILSVMNVEKLLAAKTHWFSTEESTLEKGLTSVVNVGKPPATNPSLLSTGESTLEKCRIRVALVGKCLTTART